MKFTRITTSPELMDGVPCIRGLRFPVSRYAAAAVHERELPLNVP
jgi:uncharacterized protein (DUF433 family)